MTCKKAEEMTESKTEGVESEVEPERQKEDPELGNAEEMQEQDEEDEEEKDSKQDLCRHQNVKKVQKWGATLQNL